MKILISEQQYEKMVLELNNHPENHDVEQRELRMNLLKNGIPIALRYRDFETISLKGLGDTSIIRRPIGNTISEIVGRYVLTPEVATIINQRLDDIYNYLFPRQSSYAVLVYDFLLDSNDVLNNKILYNGMPEDRKEKEHVFKIMKKRRDYGATISFTQYEPINKSEKYSPLSKEDRGEILVLLIDRNVAKTVMISSKKQFEEKTYYGLYGYPIQNYIRYDQVSSVAERLTVTDYKKEKVDPNIRFSPILISKDVKESWIMEWINSKKSVI